MNSHITCSTALMKNYKQAEVMAPDASFAALQTGAGNALLFSIGTDGVCYLTQETPGAAVGWQRSAISNTLGSAAVKQIAVSQNAVSGAIDLALVLSGAPDDTLYVSFGNSNTDLSWTSNVAWTAVPFDALGNAPSPLVMANIFISQAGTAHFIVADLLRDPSAPAPMILRYYVDPSKQLTGQCWNAHDIAGDIEAASAQSCLGRRAGDLVDGIYTAGTVDGQPQLIYQPLYNAFRPATAADPVSLAIPDGASIATAVVAVAAGVDGDANSTDLYVASGQTLYRYAADNQQQEGSGVALLSAPILQGITRLFGAASASRVILWGLNQADQVFYTSCAIASLGDPAAWSLPLPICENAEQLTPYVNRANDGNTFFIHSGAGTVKRAVQAPATTTWKLEPILLPAAPKAQALKSTSYTTRLQVMDANQQPLQNAQVMVSALHRVGVYINGLYYVLDQQPVPILADAIGAINIIEWVDNLNATPLSFIGPDSQQLAVNPMDQPFRKAAALSTPDALRAALVPGGSSGPDTPLVGAGVADADVQAAAAALGQLGTIYQTLPTDGSIAPRAQPAAAGSRIQVSALFSVPGGAGQPLPAQIQLGGFLDAIESAAGDVLRWLDSAVDYVVHVVEDQASGLWHFVAEIAGQAYSFVLDAAEKVVGAMVALYRAIKTAIEDLIAYLEFLFEWQSFVRTKDVFTQFVQLGLQNVAGNVGTLSSQLEGYLSSVRSDVDAWAGIQADTWEPGVDNNDKPLSFPATLNDMASVMTAPAMFFYHHFMDNLGGAEATPPADGSSSGDVIGRLLAALSNEGDVFVDAINRIKSTLIDGDAFTSMSLGEILKTLAGIVADAILNTAANVLDTALDFLALVLAAAIDDLSTPIWIPVISDILKDFGVTIDFSVLDMIMMVVAIPATLAYKVSFGSAPFSSGDGSEAILAAATPAGLLAVVSQSQAGAVSAPRPLGADTTLRAMPKDDAPATLGFGPFAVTLAPGVLRGLYVAGYVIAGLASLTSGVLSTIALTQDSDNDELGYSRAYTAANLATGTASAIAAFIDSPKAIQDSDMYRMSKACKFLTLAGYVLGPAAKKAFGSNASSKDVDKICKFYNAIIAFLSMTPSVFHFQELVKDGAGSARSSAFVGETAELVNDLNRIVIFFVSITDNPTTKADLVALSATLSGCYGGLQLAEAIIDPNSTASVQLDVQPPVARYA